MYSDIDSRKAKDPYHYSKPNNWHISRKAETYATYLQEVQNYEANHRIRTKRMAYLTACALPNLK
jgi:hypothetical protein